MTTDFSKLSPRQVEGYFSQLILKTFGNRVQDDAQITSSHGSYRVEFWVNDASFQFRFKKKSSPRIARAIRALGEASENVSPTR